MTANRPADRHRRQRSTAVQWVCDVLVAEVGEGRFADDVLPGEDALTRRYGVSRGVVREAMIVLQELGVIQRVRGAGTFVLSPSTWLHRITESRDLFQDINERGVRAIIRKMYIGLHRGAPMVTDRLGLEPGADVIILETMTTLDGFPLSTRTAFMPADVFGDLATDPEVNLDRSPYELIPEVTGEPVGETELYIQSGAANAIVASTLRIPVHTPVLDTSRIIRDGRGRALEYSISHARGDRLTFVTVMRSPGPAAPA